MRKLVIATLLALSLSSCVVVQDSQNVEIRTDSAYKVGI